MSHTWPEPQWVALIKSFLARPHGTATEEERQAWECFYDVHDPIIRARIRRRHTHDHENDDRAQVVWLALTTKSLPRFRPGPEPGGLTTLVVKVADDAAHRRLRRRFRRSAARGSAELTSELADPRLGPDVENRQMEDDDELRSLVERFRRAGIAERDIEIAVMHFLEDRTASEIAAVLKLTRCCVESALHRVTAKLRDCLNCDRQGVGREFFEKMQKIVRNCECFWGPRGRIYIIDASHRHTTFA